MQEFMKTDYKVLSIESKNGMVLIERYKFVYTFREHNGVQRLIARKVVYQVLTRKLENLRDLVAIT
jgi:hypothetical protein